MSETGGTLHIPGKEYWAKPEEIGTIAEEIRESRERKSWSVRIPAAIEKAEGFFAPTAKLAQVDSGNDGPDPFVYFTATEVALAKALVELWEQARLKIEFEHPGRKFAFQPHDALIDFCTKVESL